MIFDPGPLTIFSRSQGAMYSAMGETQPVVVLDPNMINFVDDGDSDGRKLKSREIYGSTVREEHCALKKILNDVEVGTNS